mgnify:CR=1 FL=1|tara:strand:- start:1101 stop:1538 length:438 start_codon:yes stop_codon:yes gene_type:complete
MKATFGMGCFWKPEDIFAKLDVETSVGYMGGDKKDPSYEQVCSGKTGHTEVVHIEYDEDKVSYSELLEIFFSNHDPTQTDGQGSDIGDQYRSVIFYYSEEQRELAEETLLAEQQKYSDPIITQVLPAADFFKAEEYHQKYVEKNK